MSMPTYMRAFTSFFSPSTLINSSQRKIYKYFLKKNCNIEDNLLGDIILV